MGALAQAGSQHPAAASPPVSNDPVPCMAGPSPSPPNCILYVEMAIGALRIIQTGTRANAAEIRIRGARSASSPRINSSGFGTQYGNPAFGIATHCARRQPGPGHRRRNPIHHPDLRRDPDFTSAAEESVCGAGQILADAVRRAGMGFRPCVGAPFRAGKLRVTRQFVPSVHPEREHADAFLAAATYADAGVPAIGVPPSAAGRQQSGRRAPRRNRTAKLDGTIAAGGDRPDSSAITSPSGAACAITCCKRSGLVARKLGHQLAPKRVAAPQSNNTGRPNEKGR